MRTVVKDEKSEWREVKSGVPQGSILAPIMFLIYVNDMTEGVCSYISLFADVAKLLRKIGNHKDCEELENDINKIYEWSKTWEMKFNAKKMPCIGNGKKCNEILMDVYVREKYYINNKRRERFGSGNTGQLITRKIYK